MGVYYRGKDTVPIGKKYVEISLPDYVKKLCSDMTVTVSVIVPDDCDGIFPTISATIVKKINLKCIVHHHHVILVG